MKLKPRCVQGDVHVPVYKDGKLVGCECGWLRVAKGG